MLRHALRARLSEVGPLLRWKRGQLPTASLYFAEPLANLIGGPLLHHGRPIRRISKTVFACGDAAVVVRYADDRELAFLERKAFRKVYLLIDDDLSALDNDDTLPADYRRRLLCFRDGVLRRLLALVTHVVAPSERILAYYGKKHGLLLDPVQCHRAAALAHHKPGQRLDVVFAATRSHLGDLELVTPALANFFRQRPDARLTTFLNGHAPKMLRRLDNAIHLSPMSWERYRTFVGAHSFHVALAPAHDTAFNRARSVSKLHDHAAFGAAGLYSALPPFSGIVGHGKSGLLLSNEPEAWGRTLHDLAANPALTLDLAAGGQALSLSLGDKHRVRQFWQGQLDLA